MVRTILLLTIASSLLFSQQSFINKFPTPDASARSCFIENKGQWDDGVLFLAKAKGLNAWITKSGIIYDHYVITTETDGKINIPAGETGTDNYRIKGHVLAMRYINALNDLEFDAAHISGPHYNYFLGNDPGSWAADVPSYKEVTVKNIYDGIDIRYYFEGGNLRYDFKVHGGADIGSIQLIMEGAGNIQVNEKNALVITTSLGDIKHGKLLAYQNSWYGAKPVACGFTYADDGTIGLDTEEFDSGKTLIIDPLVFSSFSGGSDFDKGIDVASDDDDNIYITGWTISNDYPTTFGAYDRSYNGTQDVFVSKFSSDGSTLIFSTYIGTGGADYSTGIAIDPDGNPVITGGTMATSFPTTSGAYDETHNGGRDIYVTKFSSIGSTLLWSTFVGGADWDNAEAIEIDEWGNVYITGITWSTNYPTSSGAYDRTHNGGRDDAFLTKLHSSGSSIVFSSYLGGGNYDNAFGIALDVNKAVITGYTSSTDFPVTSGAFDQTYNNGKDVFATKFNALGSSLLYSTYIGGGSNEEGLAVDINPSGWAIITGYTRSTDFPISTNAYDNTYNTGEDVFITILSSTASGALYSSYLGGGNSERGNAISYDNTGSFTVSGKTTSSTFPVTTGCYDDSYNGLGDAFISKFNSSGGVLIYSTYLGGSNSDIINGMFLIGDKDAVVTGETGSSGFPVTAGAYDQSHNGNNDAFLSQIKMTAVIPTLILNAPDGGENWQAGTNENITWTSTDVAMVTISYTSDNGTTWSVIATTPASTASFGWTVPNTPSTQCYVRIVDASNPAVWDESSAAFTIFVPELILTAPNGGETWQAGSSQEILWTSTEISQINIKYSTNNGFAWLNVASSVSAADGSYDWNVPNTPSNNCLIKITDASDLSMFDESNSTFTISEPSSIEEWNTNLIPTEYNLYQNFPNPFNPSTQIFYDLPQNGSVKLVIYNIEGEEVERMESSYKPAGRYFIEFNAAVLPSGVYFYRLQSGSFVATKKMLLLK